MKYIFFCTFLFAFACSPTSVPYDVAPDPLSVHSIFADHMVLQRDTEIVISGTATPGMEITINYAGHKLKTKTKGNGTWKSTLPPMKAGGPYLIEVYAGSNFIRYTDVLVGELWLASGQSNMEWPLVITENGKEAIAHASHPNIRITTIPKMLTNKKQKSLLPIEWSHVTPESVTNFSAVAYYFASKLEKELKVPIGIIDNSWGGTNIEGWMSEASLKGLTTYEKTIKEYQKLNLESQEGVSLIDEWLAGLDTYDLGKKSKWADPEVDKKDWVVTELPGKWEENGYPTLDGIVYYSKSISLDLDQLGDSSTLHLGMIDDDDETFINGIKVGSMIQAYNKNRHYRFPSALLKKENEIVVRVKDTGGGGGFSSTANHLYLELAHQDINLAGLWKMKIGTKGYPPRPKSQDYNGFPTNRFNGMVNPLVNFPIEGVIYYQGEANAGSYEDYGDLFRRMINDYRQLWQRDLSFLFVQLANFNGGSKNGEDTWPYLREAQASILDLPKTGMAVTIDIGNDKDIHPRNKKDVGLRLANAALAIAYGMDQFYQSPQLISTRPVTNGIEAEFKYVGEGLKTTDGNPYIPAFSISTDRKTFHETKAKIIATNRVLVLSDQPHKIMELRYAFKNTPGKVTLINSHGLPAAPGRIIMMKR